MLEGWLALGLAPERVAALDPHPPPETEAPAVAQGHRAQPEPRDARWAGCPVVAVKPHMMANAVLGHIAPRLGPSTLVLSIMAGKTLAGIDTLLGREVAIVRAMPNTPAAIGRGITVAVANARSTARHRATADALLRSTGGVEWIEDEALMDAVTAVSGSGPGLCLPSRRGACGRRRGARGCPSRSPCALLARPCRAQASSSTAATPRRISCAGTSPARAARQRRPWRS